MRNDFEGREEHQYMALTFDGMGIPQWKVLMKAQHQVRGPDIRRVIEKDMKNETKAHRIFEAVARSTIFCSLNEILLLLA